MSRGDGQTNRGAAEVPQGAGYDRSGTKGTGNEALRQSGTKLTSTFPEINESRNRKQGSPGREAGGQNERGWGVAGSGNQQTDDATVSADGRRRVKHIEGD
jgi:hypothetical protein